MSKPSHFLVAAAVRSKHICCCTSRVRRRWRERHTCGYCRSLICFAAVMFRWRLPLGVLSEDDHSTTSVSSGHQQPVFAHCNSTTSRETNPSLPSSFPILELVDSAVCERQVSKVSQTFDVQKTHRRRRLSTKLARDDRRSASFFILTSRCFLLSLAWRGSTWEASEPPAHMLFHSECTCTICKKICRRLSKRLFAERT